MSDQSLQKTDFGAIYDQADPRAYFRRLQPYRYVIPQYGADAFSNLLDTVHRGGRPPNVLDVASSYGIVGTLLRTDLRLTDLYKHYTAAPTVTHSPDVLRETDRRLLADHRISTAPRVVGLDVAPNAVAYGVDIGAMDAGVSENLEDGPPSDRLAGMLADIDLITTTGGVGYVTERTFDRLMRCCHERVWVAAFCLRTYDYEPIAGVLAEYGLRTERMGRTFPQRRFTGDDEREWAISRVRERGLDPTGKESDGWYHADLYLSRPLNAAEQRGVDELLTDAF